METAVHLTTSIQYSAARRSIVRHRYLHYLTQLYSPCSERIARQQTGRCIASLRVKRPLVSIQTRSGVIETSMHAGVYEKSNKKSLFRTRNAHRKQ